MHKGLRVLAVDLAPGLRTLAGVPRLRQQRGRVDFVQIVLDFLAIQFNRLRRQRQPYRGDTGIGQRHPKLERFFLGRTRLNIKRLAIQARARSPDSVGLDRRIERCKFVAAGQIDLSDRAR